MKNKKLIIRNPNSVRPWQYILDVLNGYLVQVFYLSRNKRKHLESYNFAPVQRDIVTVKEIVNYISNYFGFNKITFLEQSKGFKESKNLMLNSRKAYRELGWKNKYKTLGAIDQTIKWSEVYYSKPKEIEKYSIGLIEDFFKL